MKLLNRSLMLASLAMLAAMIPVSAIESGDEDVNPTPDVDSVLTAAEAEAIAREAYIFGAAFNSNYRVFINRLVIGDPLMQGAGFNEFAHNRELFPPETPDTTQRDALFSLGILDLRREPVVISVPDVPEGEVYMLQMGDTSTETLPYISTRTTDNKAGDYVMVGPDFQGYLPADRFAGIITTRGQFIVMVGRTLVTDPDDLAAAHAIQDGMRMQPLSEFLGTAAPADPGPMDFIPWEDDKAAGLGAFSYINMALAWHPPAWSEMDDMARFARIGVVPGQRFMTEGFSKDIVAAMEAGVAAAREEIEARSDQPGQAVENWTWNTQDTSRFGQDYLFRAAVGHKTIYPNAPDHALYGMASQYPDGKLLNGSKGAMIRFEGDALPPADWFWNVTLYDTGTTAMYPNPTGRVSVGNKTKGLVSGEDGSVTLYVSHAEPTDPARRANWLPAPEGDIYLVLRLYAAQEEALEGRWNPPPVTRFAE